MVQPATPVYLDYAATTPLDPRVRAAMEPYFSNLFGNPSSLHFAGQKAEAAVERSRQTVAGILGCAPEEIIFTSGGTESDNLALRGVANELIALGCESMVQGLTGHAAEAYAALSQMQARHPEAAERARRRGPGRDGLRGGGGGA